MMTPTSPHTALLLVDVIHDFDFDGGEALLEQARSISRPLRYLLDAAHAATVPAIYVNDHFGAWRSSFEEIIARCEKGLGADFVRALEPTDDDYFVLKPHRSGFYGTPLELLLRKLGVERLVLAGLTTDMCILATANDARMRDYDVWIASDASAALNDERHAAALRLMSISLDATCRKAEAIDLGSYQLDGR